MVAGLPGTGVGGLFYLLLILGMPAREFWRSLRRGGRPDAARWRTVGLMVGIAVAVVGALAGVGWVLRALPDLVAWLVPAGPASAPAGAVEGVVLRGMSPALGLVPPAILALLWLGIHALRLALRGAPPVRPALPPIRLASAAERRRVRGEGRRAAAFLAATP